MKYAITLLFALWSISVMAQQSMHIDVASKYGIDYRDGSKVVSQKWPAGQDTIFLRYAWAKWRREGMPYATFRSRYVGCAVAKDAAWYNEQESFLNNNAQNTYTFADWTGCPGKYLMNATVQIPRGGMKGCSSFGYHGNGNDHGQYATEFAMDDVTWWNGTSTERRVFEAPNASRTDFGAYNEGINLTDFRITGPLKADGITRVGIYLSRLGSTSYVDRIVSNGFTKGWVLVDGCPGYMGTIRAFQCDVGLSGEATWGAIVKIGMLETDGCKRSFQLIPNAQGAAGGTWRIGLKVEDGVTAGMPIANTIAGWLEGQYDVEVWGNFTYQNGAKPTHLFVVYPTLGNGANQNSRLRVSGKGTGYGKLLKSNLTGSEWNGAGDYAAFDAEHYAANDAVTTSCQSITKVGTTAPPVDPPTPPTGGGYADRTGWVAECTVVSVSGEWPANAIDGDAGTRYSTGKPMEVGTRFAVTMPSAVNLTGVRVDFGTDYPAAYTCQVKQGLTWTNIAVPPAQTITTINFGEVKSTKGVRITVTGTRPKWFSVYDIQGIK